MNESPPVEPSGHVATNAMGEDDDAAGERAQAHGATNALVNLERQSLYRGCLRIHGLRFDVL